jgi:uncharacterized protein YjeT (DUF2065 family)
VNAIAINLEWNDLLRAGALMLVFEGLLPVISPARAKALYAGVAGLEPAAVRRIGLASMICGAAALQAIHWLG